jgi:PIN domain nuclease of toxin-antitoxin system
MIVLDTHVWIWFLSNPDLLSDAAQNHIELAAEKDDIFISSISVWEVALLVQKKRLALKVDVNEWISAAESLRFFNFVPIDNAIALRSVNLPPPLHCDPADRIIIASALDLDALLITKDEKILNYPFVNTLW